MAIAKIEQLETLHLKSRDPEHLLANRLVAQQSLQLMPTALMANREDALEAHVNLKIPLVASKIVDLQDEEDPLVRTKRNQTKSRRTMLPQPRDLPLESPNYKPGANLRFDREAAKGKPGLLLPTAVFAYERMMKKPHPILRIFLGQIVIVEKKFLKLTRRCSLMTTSLCRRSKRKEALGQLWMRKPTFLMTCSPELILRVFTHRITPSENCCGPQDSVRTSICRRHEACINFGAHWCLKLTLTLSLWDTSTRRRHGRYVSSVHFL